MSRPPVVLTGPQAVALGLAAGLAWTYRQTLRAAGHFIRCGPNLLGWFNDEDFDDFIQEQQARFEALASNT